MRYLITGTHSEAKVTLGYDADGMLCEVQVADMPTEDARAWTFRNAPLLEADVRAKFSAAHLKVTVLEVTFEQFWLRYAYKEGKKDAQRAWDRMSEADRQLAFNHIERYRSACTRDRKHLMYPATYLRAERWLDHL